jgi:ribose transport system substrate-binding protein
MSNPVGAGRAVEEAGKAGKVIIVGMDHDERAIKYLRDGVIYALAIQDCYSIGFDTITTAIKIADGLEPGSLYPEKTEEKTTVFYQKDAAGLLRSLYGIME